MSKPQSPCKGCIERMFNCHGTCIHYKAYKNELERWGNKIAKAKDEEYITIDKSKLKGIDK